MLSAHVIQDTVKKLSYYAGDIDGNLASSDFRSALRMFQSDMGLDRDGWYGPKSDAVLAPLAASLVKAPEGFVQTRRWRLTRYWIADEKEYKTGQDVPVYDKNKNVLALVGPTFFANMSLEGTGRTKGSVLLNVSGDYVSVSADDYAPVLKVAKDILSAHIGYAGIVVSNDRVTKAFAFDRVTNLGKGYGVQRGVPMDPFRTLAADIGAYKKCDPKYKGHGGLVPAGTKVWIPAFVNVGLPDGTTHDGWCTVNDTGSAIFGAHFDVFAGTSEMRRRFKSPAIGQVWFQGIEDRVPVNYTYGLVAS